MMGNSADWTDAIAKVQVWRSVLSFLEPDGKWRNLPLLGRWEQNRYALTLPECERLVGQLQREYQKAYKRVLQRRLAGHRRDEKRIQLELPGVRYGS